jgi:hypothetical protein
MLTVLFYLTSGGPCPIAFSSIQHRFSLISLQLGPAWHGYGFSFGTADSHREPCSHPVCKTRQQDASCWSVFLKRRTCLKNCSVHRCAMRRHAASPFNESQSFMTSVSQTGSRKRVPEHRPGAGVLAGPMPRTAAMRLVLHGAPARRCQTSHPTTPEPRSEVVLPEAASKEDQ